jgi:hypothetical protein
MQCREAEALMHCDAIIDQTRDLGGVVTISWHERSLAPERQWEGTYKELLRSLHRRKASIRPAREIVMWFQTRRAVNLEGVHADPDALRRRATHPGSAENGQLLLRVYGSREHTGGQDRSVVTDLPFDDGDFEAVFSRRDGFRS